MKKIKWKKILSTVGIIFVIILFLSGLYTIISDLISSYKNGNLEGVKENCFIFLLFATFYFMLDALPYLIDKLPPNRNFAFHNSGIELSWCFIIFLNGLLIYYFLTELVTFLLAKNYDYSLGRFALIPLILLCFWTIFSMEKGLRNALLLFRSVLIVSLSIFIWGIFNSVANIQNWIVNADFGDIIGIIILIVFISLSIKCLIISFNPKNFRVFKNQKARFVDILIIVILCVSAACLYKLDIKIDSKNTPTEYPVLNQSK